MWYALGAILVVAAFVWWALSDEGPDLGGDADAGGPADRNDPRPGKRKKK